jgi:hypothetical protein
LYVTNVPTSVPTYSVFAYAGSRTTEFTGLSGRLALMSSHVCPPSFVRKTWPGRLGVAALNPEYAAYAIR